MDEKWPMMRKRIGMLTYHQCHNYGAMLCAYALQQNIMSIGYETEYVNVENEIFVEYGKKAGHQLYQRRDAEADRYREVYRRELEERWRFFENFKRKYLQCSKKINNEQEMGLLLKDYDILLIGGDQLWNEDLPVSIDIFVLPFETAIKKVSFGTSMGGSRSMSLLRRMYLRKFAAIGVRETYAAKFIRKYTDVPAVVTVDPVFLLEKKRWEQLSELPPKDTYIFVYLFNKKNEDFLLRVNQLCKIAKKYQKRIVFCASDMTEAAMVLDVKIAIGPKAWLGYILNAEFVITNSFHGVAFSLIFEKDFMCLDTDCRKEELLSSCELLSRMGHDVEAYEYMKEEKIDYTYVKYKLDEKISQSHRFLKMELF